MAIEFHCVHCSHQIRTSEENAGKYGKCPHCKNKVYVPTPVKESDLLKLAPLDDGEERERQRLLKETQELTRKIMTEKEKSSEGGARPGGAAETVRAGGGARPAGASSPVSSTSSRDVAMPKADMETMILEYAICMADGELAEAEELARDIRGDMASANKVIQRLMMDEILPQQIARIPRPVLNGFFKQLREGK